MSDANTSNNDIFVANKVFPDAKGIFYNGYKSLEQVRDTCIVVLDTNALLVPYGISKSSLSQIASTYTSLAGASRLVIPGQVTREFANNRPRKIAEIFQTLSRRRGMQFIDRVSYPLLEGAPGYDKLGEVEDQINGLITQYRGAIGDLLNHIRNWNWDDPVSTIYSKILPSAVLDVTIEEAAIQECLQYQQANKLPPGYKDAGKDDNGIGDQLIWRVVVHVAKERKQHVVFVSGDFKADWFHRSENQPLFPRFELVDEIRRVSDGKSLHIIPFSKFLELFGATAEAVDEVQKEEVKIDLSSMSRRDRSMIKGFLAEEAVAQWLRQTYPQFEIARTDGLADYVWLERGGASILVHVLSFSGDRTKVHLVERLKVLFSRFDRHYVREDFQFDNLLVFLVFASHEAADSAVEDLPQILLRFEQRQPLVVVAHLAKDGLLTVQDPTNALPSFE